VLHVASAARAEAFYCAQLGFQKRFEYRPHAAKPDPCYLGLARDQAWLHVSSFAGDGVSGAAVYLLVERVDRLHEELRAKRVAIDLEPTDQTWGNREMYIRDPDGNCIRFIEAGDA